MTISSKNPKGWDRFKKLASTISVEPVMLLDGLAFSNMVVLVENLQMDKICLNSLGESEDVCHNLNDHTDIKRDMTKEASVFQMYNGIIISLIPLFFILFMGAWSDKYGRKVPLVASMIGHLLYSSGYLVNSLFMKWPVEWLLVVALFESLGGGAVSFLTAANSYISDVSDENTRTSRIGLANSIWFLGGPMGTLMGKFIFDAGGYIWVFGVSAVMHIVAILYILFYLPESHGPFSNKERMSKIMPAKPSLRVRESIAWMYGIDKKKKQGSTRTKRSGELAREDITFRMMVSDFFNPQRLIESVKSTIRPREGHVRMYVLLLIFSNVLRRLGRGAFMFIFTRIVLQWNSSDYGLWVTYKNFISSIGCLVAVPLLSAKFQVSDKVLAMIGAMASVADYTLYGLCVSEDTEIFLWIAPAAALLVNSCAIAIRAMLSKYISPDELGKVSAVLGALDGMAPMLNFPLYTAVFTASVDVFPGGQFFFGAGLNLLMAAIFILIMCSDRTAEYNLETALPPKPKGPVQEKALVMRQDSRWLFDEDNEKEKKIRFSTIILSSINFAIEVPEIEKLLRAPLDPIKEVSEEETTEDIPKQQQISQQRTYNNDAYVKETD